MDAADVVVIGAGPAGLTAATYLARFRRRVLVLDGGPPRAALIPESHNTPGFPAGVSGPALLERLRVQATEHGAVIRDAYAERLTPTADGVVAEVAGERVEARFALLAAGVRDRMPELAGLDAAIERRLVRFCPICDAYEAIDKRIAVLADGPHGAGEALFLTTYSADVTLLHAGPPLGDGLARRLAQAGVAVAPARPEAVRLGAETAEVCGRVFDCLYIALGCEAAPIVRSLALARDGDGAVLVDAHQQTSIDRVYAAGDMVRGLSQIAVAAGEAAIAATRIHRRLLDEAG